MWLNKFCNEFVSRRWFCTQRLAKEVKKLTFQEKNDLPEPEYNIEYLCNPANRDEIHNNIQKRKSNGDINRVLELAENEKLRSTFLQELNKIPNRTNPESKCETEKILREHARKPEYTFKPKEFSELVEPLRLMRTESLGPIAGQRAYVLLGDLAELEEALVQYTTERLLKHRFNLVSVPDILPTKIIERCGLLSDHGHTLVYNLHDSYGQYSLSGTAEMALAFRQMNKTFSAEELPLRIAAVSRCFRAETSSTLSEKGIFRVHQFTKVEMFVCSTQEGSADAFEELLGIQEDLFSSLGLHFRVVEMPLHDLGPAAYRKVDMEGWMPGRDLYGELSSCSNCTDYQARRLNIKYKTKNGKLLHVHTLNGTGCAIPRMLIALCETYQTSHSRIKVPEILIPYLNGNTLIKKQPVAEMRVFKFKPKLC